MAAGYRKIPAVDVQTFRSANIREIRSVSANFRSNLRLPPLHVRTPVNTCPPPDSGIRFLIASGFWLLSRLSLQSAPSFFLLFPAC